MPAPDDTTSTLDELAIAHDAVLRAGETALTFFRKRTKAWIKEDGTPVSEADLAVDAVLQDLLAARSPGYGWQSEESGERKDGTARRFWLADPIDGTSAFLAGSQDWCIALALIDDGVPVAGVIHAPAIEATYLARLGRGASRNGLPITVSNRQSLEGARVLSNASALKPASWARALPAVQRIVTPSLALRLAQVAEGTSDVALALTPKHGWDLAAGDLIVREAGGVMSNAEGARIAYGAPHPCSAFIAANPTLHALLLDHRPHSQS